MLAIRGSLVRSRVAEVCNDWCDRGSAKTFKDPSPLISPPLNVVRIVLDLTTDLGGIYKNVHANSSVLDALPVYGGDYVVHMLRPHLFPPASLRSL